MVIVGAGVSGLATAVSLARNGIRSLVLEQKPAAGGRASSFRDATTGEVVDNGQHVLIAGYKRTMEFLTGIGTLNLLAVQPQPALLFHHPLRGFRRFSVPRLSSPLHVGTAIATSNLFRLSDRVRLLRAGRALANRNATVPEDATITEWLDMTRQSQEVRRSFWEPLAVSIMNELPQLAAAAPFIRSLREAFIGPWRNGCLAFPTVSLTHLYAHRAVEFIHSRGGEVRCSQDVRQLLVRENVVEGVVLRDGTPIHARAVVLSVPPYRLGDLAVGRTGGIDINALRQFSYSPIVSTHLWFKHGFMPQQFVGLIGRRTQWVFNRRRIESTDSPLAHLSTVTSAAHDLVDCSNDEIVQSSLDDLRTVFGSRVDRPYHSVVVREKRATISLTPSAERARPPQRTESPNLFLAGDWTRTGYPATIEGAVISGERCAGYATAYLNDHPATV